MAGDSRIGNPPRTGGESPLSDTEETPVTRGFWLLSYVRGSESGLSSRKLLAFGLSPRFRTSARQSLSEGLPPGAA